MIVLDGTIVTVALPTIQDDLGFSQTGLSWVVNAYLIGFGGLLLLAGRFADLFGRRRLFMVGVAIFTTASAVCGAAQEPWMLVAARAVQGVGGAVMAAVAFAILISTFTDARRPRPGPRRLGLHGLRRRLASACCSGGVLTASFSWHWIFLVNVPIGIAGLRARAAAARSRPGRRGAPARRRPRRRHDRRGLAIGGLRHRRRGRPRLERPRHASPCSRWPSPCVGAFIVIERRTAEPLVPVRPLPLAARSPWPTRSRCWSWPGMFGWFFFGALYLQEVLGFSTLQTGLAFLPATLALGILSIGLSAKIALTVGPRRALVVGLLLGGAGVLLLARASADGTYVVDVLPVPAAASASASAWRSCRSS